MAPGRSGGALGAVVAVLLVGASAVFVVSAGVPKLRLPLVGPEGERIAGISIAARAAERFDLLYPTVADGWRQPTLAQPVLSRPPGTDFAARVAFLGGGDHAATARAVGLGSTAAALVALARLAWIGWGAWAAVGASALFALLPYTASHGVHPHGGMPALAAVLMALGSMVRFRRTRGRLSAISGVLWTLVAGVFDWSAYMIVVPLGVLALAGETVQSRLARVRPQTLGLPDGLSGPLANILLRREGQTAQTLTVALAIAIGAELLFFLAWFLKLGAFVSFFATMGGAGAEPAISSVAPPNPFAPALVGPAAVLVVMLWVAAAGGRVLFGQSEIRSAPVLALLVAGVLYPVLFRGLARTSYHLPALAVGGVVLAAVDAAAVLGTLAATRRLVAPDMARPPPLATAVSLGLMLLLAASGIPRFGRAQAEVLARAPSADDQTRHAFARAADDATEAGDRLLLLAGFPADLRFRMRVDRDLEIVPTLAGLEARRARDPRLVALLAEPLPEGETKHLTPLLQQHPALRIPPLWMVDLRRYEPGIRSYALERGALVPRPWEALKLDVAHGVSPSHDYVPEIGGDLALSREELLAYHNLHNARGNAESARARARLLDGYSTAPRWMDPAPFGQPAGVRWDARARRLDVLWQCTGTPPALPAGVGVAGGRFVITHAARDWRPVVLDRPMDDPCPPQARAGELHEQSFALKLPYRGKLRVALQLMRAGKPKRPLHPAPVDLGVIESASGE